MSREAQAAEQRLFNDPGRRPKRMDRMRQALRSRHFRPRTERTCRHWIRRFIFHHHGRHSAETAEVEIARRVRGPAAAHRPDSA